MAYHLDALHAQPRALFTDVRFIVLALILGVACMDALLSTDNLWIPMAWHGALRCGARLPRVCRAFEHCAFEHCAALRCVALRVCCIGKGVT